LNAVYRLTVVALLSGILAVQFAILERMPLNVGDVADLRDDDASKEDRIEAQRRAVFVRIDGSVNVNAIDPLPVEIQRP